MCGSGHGLSTGNGNMDWRFPGHADRYSHHCMLYIYMHSDTPPTIRWHTHTYRLRDTRRSCVHMYFMRQCKTLAVDHETTPRRHTQTVEPRGHDWHDCAAILMHTHVNATHECQACQGYTAAVVVGAGDTIQRCGRLGDTCGCVHTTIARCTRCRCTCGDWCTHYT